jgi:hypothetical protein
MHLLEEIRARRVEVKRNFGSTEELAKIWNAESKAIVSFGRLNGEGNLDESRITESPRVQTLLREMLESVAAWPDALAAMQTRMRGLSL